MDLTPIQIQKTVQTGKIKVNDTELYYEVHGEGDPIILIHGTAVNLNIWKTQIDYFSKNHQVLAYDVRGQGQSDKPHGEYSIQIFADDLYALMRGLNFKKATIVGHSNGGFIALQFALDHPEMVSKLILIDSAAKIDRMMYYMSWVLMHIFPYKTNWRMLVNQQAVETMSEQDKEAAVNMFMGTPKYVTLKLQDANTKFDFHDKLSKIKVPTLIIVGEKDTLMPVEKSQFLYRGISGSKLVVIPNAKHMTIKYNSKEVNNEIEEFIK